MATKTNVRKCRHVQFKRAAFKWTRVMTPTPLLYIPSSEQAASAVSADLVRITTRCRNHQRSAFYCSEEKLRARGGLPTSHETDATRHKYWNTGWLSDESESNKQAWGRFTKHRLESKGEDSTYPVYQVLCSIQSSRYKYTAEKEHSCSLIKSIKFKKVRFVWIKGHETFNLPTY